jgi:hypothetical protein
MNIIQMPRYLSFKTPKPKARHPRRPKVKFGAYVLPNGCRLLIMRRAEAREKSWPANMSA